MANQIIIQPDGKYCIYSSIVDNVTSYDMTEEEIVELWVSEFRAEVKDSVRKIITKLKEGENPYFQFTMNYNEMIEKIREIHGNDNADTIVKLIQG